jgi:hypothetical protein
MSKVVPLGFTSPPPQLINTILSRTVLRIKKAFLIFIRIKFIFSFGNENIMPKLSFARKIIAILHKKLDK